MSKKTMVLSAVEEVWYERAGLSHDPFADHVPGFKFFAAQRKPVLAQLHHLARYSQLMLLVLGPKGSGKSLLRQALMASSNKQSTQCLSMSAALDDSADSMLTQVAAAVGAQAPSVESIMARVGEASLNNQEFYLLVDDAQCLSQGDLGALLALSVGGAEGRIHVFLFGELGLEARIEQVAGAVEGCHSIHLQPYTAEETAAYLAQRLEAAGGDLGALSNSQVDEIHRRSGGWPGEINAVARALFATELDDPEPLEGLAVARTSWAIPWRALLSLAGVGVAAASAAFFFADQLGLTSSGRGKPLPAAIESHALSIADTSPSNASTRVEFSGASKPLPLPLVGEAQTVLRDSLAEGVSNDGRVAMLDLSESISYERPSEAIAEAGESPVDTSGAGAQSSGGAAAMERVAGEQMISVARAPSPSAAEDRQVIPPVASKPVAQPAIPPAPYAWYLEQAGTRYVLQVLGTRSEQVAKELVARHGEGFNYFSKPHQGKPLYVVTYGNFASRQQANGAIGRLPAPLRSGSQPWPRPFSDVQQEIRAAR